MTETRIASPVSTAPSAALRRVPPARRNGRVIAVASGKGGVGKTWFAITLAHALARRGARVLLFDGDLGLANVDIQLGLLPDRDLAAVIGGVMSLRQAALHHEGGFDIVAGRSGSGALAAMDGAALAGVLRALREATREYDHVILDLGAGLDAAVRRMAVFADLLLVVATEEPTSLTDAYAVLKLHAADRAAAAGTGTGTGTGAGAGQGAGEARIVINQSASRGGGERTYATLARACAAFLGSTPKLAGVVRRDERVRDAIRRQTLMLARHPTGPASEDVEAVAAGLG